MNGSQLAAVYSWNCRTAKKLKVSKKLFDFASGKTDDNRGVKKILMALGPYKSYLSIAKSKHLSDKFALAVISFYWRNLHNRDVIAPLCRLPLSKINQQNSF